MLTRDESFEARSTVVSGSPCMRADAMEPDCLQ